MKSNRLFLNPLLSSITHESFAKALEQLGCTPLPKEVFDQEIQPHLASHFPETEKVWDAICSGEVLATEAAEDGKYVFLVRGGVSGTYIDVRLTYKTDTWHVQSVTSIHKRPFTRTPLFTWLTLGVSVILAGFIGYAAAPRSQTVAVPNVPQWASEHGYTLVKNNPIPKKMPAQPTTSTSKSLTFTLKPGMSLHDLSLYLEHQHLVKDAVAFDQKLKQAGVDRTIRPGNYTFNTNMNESQLIHVLQSGPKK